MYIHTFARSLVLITAILLSITSSSAVAAQQNANVSVLTLPTEIKPLQSLTILSNAKGTINVTDSKGQTYFTARALPQVQFVTGGAAGKQTITLTNSKGKVLATTHFELVAKTEFSENKGELTELYNISLNGLMKTSNDGYGKKTNPYNELRLGDKNYRFYITWDLDNSNVMNGMQYFLPYGAGLTDLLRETQAADGMIWSSMRPLDGDKDYKHYETTYGKYFQKFDGCWGYRQPVDNHSDYYFVNMLYKHWKASGDTQWMQKSVEAASRALDYCVNDTLRWSRRFELLKRPLCIDSWDFQVDDDYTPAAPVSPTMVLVPGKTKFGVFFGDNTGYYEACNMLSEMYRALNEKALAAKYSERAESILKNLLKVSWNGRFFTHFVDEDASVVRKLGVDMKAQIAQSNMYSLTRGLPLDINKQILNTYKELKTNLPKGSPGEWYAIYPPFEKGFEGHGGKWQYMNGGIAAHAIGELVRGAFENGAEKYGADVLLRTLEMAKSSNNHLYFAYTGAFPTPAKPVYKTLDLSKVANMDLWDKGGANSVKWMNDARPENDMRNIPTGNQIMNNILFHIVNPEENQRRSAVAVSTNKALPKSSEIIVNDTAASVYLLHSYSGNGKNEVAASFSIQYADGTSYTTYIHNKTDISGWWYPAIKNNDKAGVAWLGTNPLSTGVGVCWLAIDNPFPNKKIAKFQIKASEEEGMYAVLGITLSNKPH